MASTRIGWWGAATALLVLICAIYADSLQYMLRIWLSDENYGHGIFVPFIAIALLWIKRHTVAEIPVTHQWWSFAFLIFAAALFVVGTLAALYIVQLLSWWLCILALVTAIIGVSGSRSITFPLAFLLTMLPLPQFVSQGIANQLQLISSSLGVGCLQLVGITAFREGNVIDLGPIQLQVVEACSGLRYLIPLMTLALLFAYLFNRIWWKRILICLSSIPIAIMLNGLRIGLVGVLVELFGVAAADGASHLIEGWMLFVASVGLLSLVVWSLRPQPLFQFSETSPLAVTTAGAASLSATPWWRSLSFVTFTTVIVGLSIAAPRVQTGTFINVHRNTFTEFPLQIDRWKGVSFPLEKAYLDSLRLDDYLLAEYQAPETQPITLYSAYYRSQKAGQSTHSPAICIPGGGWEILSHTQHPIPAMHHRPALTVNRVTIQKGAQKQVVYYWFKQRHRFMTHEYAVKGWLFWDALFLHRTDGALIRLSSVISEQEHETTVDSRLEQFTRLATPALVSFIPD